MAKIYNNEVTKGLAQNAAIQQNVDKVPNELAEKIVPVIETNPMLLRRTNVVYETIGRNTTATGQTVVTGSSYSGRKFFITGILVSCNQDANCDNTYINMAVTLPDGTTKYIYTRRKPTTTAMSWIDYLSFPIAIEIKDSSSIYYTLAFTAGSSTADFHVYGYHVDNINA